MVMVKVINNLWLTSQLYVYIVTNLLYASATENISLPASDDNIKDANVNIFTVICNTFTMHALYLPLPW